MRAVLFIVALVVSFFLFNPEVQASPFVVSDNYPGTETTQDEQTEIALAPRRLGERANRFDAFNQFGTAEAAPSSGYILLSGTTDKLLLSGTTDTLLISQ